MNSIDDGKYCNLVDRIMKFMGFTSMQVDVNKHTKECRLVMYRDFLPIMGGNWSPVEKMYDMEYLFKEFIDDWFIESAAGTMVMQKVRGSSKHTLVSKSYAELELKLTLRGF